MKRNNNFIWLCLVYLVFVASCTSAPEPIAFGKDVCGYCKMVISDARFGAELVTVKGRVHKYDSVECLIAHVHEGSLEHKQLLAIAYDRPKNLYPVDSLSFVQSPDYRGPMGNIAAFHNTDSLKELNLMPWIDIYRQSTKTNK